MPRLLPAILIASLLLTDPTRCLQAEPATKNPEPLKRWFLTIQKLGARYGKGPTQVVTKLRRTELIEQINQQFNGSQIQFRTKIREVRWKNGIAEVYTLSELAFAGNPTPRMPLRLTRSQPFEFVLEEQVAAQIRPGQWLSFTGRLTFHPGRWGAVGRATNSQQLYSLSHQYLSGSYLGTFTSDEYECTIDKRVVPGRWAGKAKDAEKEKVDEK